MYYLLYLIIMRKKPNNSFEFYKFVRASVCRLLFLARGKSGQREETHHLTGGFHKCVETESVAENYRLYFGKGKGENVW